MNGNGAGKLSEGELEMMGLLWACEEGLTINEAHQAMARPIGYTTIQTRLNRLVEKGVVRKSKDRPAKYVAVLTAEEAGASHLDALVDQVARGSVVPLVAQLLANRKLSAEEIAELKGFIEEAEAGAGE